MIPAEAIKLIEEMTNAKTMKSRCRFNIILNGTDRTFQLQSDSPFTCQRWVSALGRLGASIDHPQEKSVVQQGEKFWKAKNYTRNKRRQAIVAGAVNPSKRSMIAQNDRQTKKTQETTSMILLAVQKSVAFQRLDDEQKQQIVQLMWRVEFTKGQDIIEAGERGDNFYVVEGGSVGVYERSGDSNRFEEVDVQNNGTRWVFAGVRVAAKFSPNQQRTSSRPILFQSLFQGV